MTINPIAIYGFQRQQFWGRPHIMSSNEGEGVTPLMTFDEEEGWS
jgi:hypothetical protein